MIAALLQNRSGRIIALCRATLAFVFFAAVWIDPAQPVRAAALGYALIGAYFAISLALLAVAMTSWWWDHRLAWPTIVIDVVSFIAAVFFTENANDDFTSPFLAFFAFLMLATTIRWDWRITALTGVVVTGLYLTVGLVFAAAEIDFNMLRFGRRVAYMLVLSVIVIWFGLQRREQHVGPFSEAPKPGAGLLAPLEGALAYAIAQTGARAGAIAWTDGEEPAIELRTSGLEVPDGRLSPSDLPEERAFGDKVRLFSSDRARSLRSSSHGRPVASPTHMSEPLADLLGVGEALALPFSGGTGHGEIILTGIKGVSSDHVVIGQSIAREVGAALDRHATLLFAHQTALARTRDALAGDLHDNIAQSLAGAALRLEGLRTSIRAGHDPEVEILQLKSALRTEQKQVRAMIDRLRNGEEGSRSANISTSLAPLASELSKNWSVAIHLDCPKSLIGPAELRYEISSILREAVANAVRHGKARVMWLAIGTEGSMLALEITDDGSGFPSGTGPEAPRSIRERVWRHGGSLAVRSGSGGTVLSIRLPLGDKA